MRKSVGMAVVAVLGMVSVWTIHPHRSRPGGPAVPFCERQTLRDALNSDYSDLNGDVKHILSDMKTQASGPAALSGAAVPAAQDAAAAKTKEAGAAIARCATNRGFYAGKDYGQYWTRDVGYSAEVLINAGYADTVAAHLEELLKRQRPSGQIPTEVNTWEGIVRGMDPKLLIRGFEYRGLHAFDDMGEFLANFHNGEADSLLIFLVTVKTYENMTGRDTFSVKHKDQIARLIKYVETLKDANGMVPGSAWFDAMMNYHGKSTLHNQIWLYKMYKAYGMQAQMQRTQGLLESFWDAKLGYYVDYKGGDHFDTLSSAMLLTEGLVPPDRVKPILDMLAKMRTRYGYLDLYPTYPPEVCSERLYEYQNSTIWPFIELRIAQAYAKYGMTNEVRQIKALMESRQGVNEWYSPLNGKPNGSADQLWTACAYLGVSKLVDGGAVGLSRSFVP